MRTFSHSSEAKPKEKETTIKTDLLREQTQIRQGSEVLHATWTEILLRSRSQEDEGGSFVFCKKLLGQFCDDDLLRFLLAVY